MTRSCPVNHFASLVPWSEFAPPFRPAPSDIAVVQRLIDETTPQTALLLGLTPEIAACRWPNAVQLTAVDHSQEMIERMWPPPLAPMGARAVCADWCEMPLPSASVDLVVGDGCLLLLTYEGWTRLAREVARVLKPSGRFVMRVFLRPDVGEPVSAIGADLAAGRIPDLHALKMRLFAAAHTNGSRLHDIWLAWSTMRRGPGPGFSPISVEAMERYENSESRYFFGTAEETSSILGEELFQISSTTPTGYALCERCPTLIFRRHDGS